MSGADLRAAGDGEAFDERVLGRGEFVMSVSRQADNQPKLKGTLDEAMNQAVKDAGIDAKDVFSRNRVRKVVRAGALYCYLAKERCGASGAQLMKQFIKEQH